MPAALLGATSCGRCGASTVEGDDACASCGVTLLDAASGEVIGTYAGLLAGVVPADSTRRRVAAGIDGAVVLVPVILGVTLATTGAATLSVGVLVMLIGGAGFATHVVTVTRRGRSLARMILGLRSADDLTGMPVRAPRAVLGLLAGGSARGTLTADLRSGRDPLRSGISPLEADALGAESVRPTGRRRAVEDRRTDGAGRGTVRSVVLVADSGTHIEVSGPLLIGRTPANPEGQAHQVRAIPDLSRSLSKTHALLEWTGAVLWVTDLATTNGTRLIAPDGRIQALVPDVRGAAGLGWTVQFGDRSFVVQADEVDDV